MIAALATERALLACLVAAAFGWLLATMALAAHDSAQLPFAPQRGTWWAALRKLARLLMWCALATGALSLLLNVVRFARAS